jgi:hypothetical protein
MSRALLTALLALAAWPAAAAADTVAHRTPVIGPVIAGAQTVWGEERDEGVRVIIGAPRTQPRAVYRLADSGARKTERAFFKTPWSLSASATHVATIVLTGTVTSEGSDFVGTTTSSAAVGGPLGEVATLSGRTPPRGDAPCEGEATYPDSVAVEGTRIAVAEEHGTCGDRDRSARVVIRDGDAVRTVPVPRFSTTRLRLAGRFVAWIESGSPEETLVVHDLEAGADVLRERRYIFGDLDLGADGTVAFTYADGTRGRRLGVMRAGTPGLRVLDRGVSDRGVALAGGRVLYEKIDRGDFRSRLLLRELGGGTRRLATFTARRRPVGDIDLSSDRAVWAAQKTRSADYEAKPSGPARIVSRPL